ncbi:MAG: ABC transporter ATP-binding protein [Calditerrivibrio sp.]|nr:ABC transporter ATP-binding protein [Calditerrivibrio sp.]
MENILLKIDNITKKFGSFYANKDISFTVRKGEILTILGENGAGKSTLMNIITGFYRQDSGTITINGEKVLYKSPRDAMQYGIGMVHQHFMLVKNHTVFENLYVSLKEKKFLINKDIYKDIFGKIFQEFNLNIDMDAPLWKLSIGEQQWIEIVKLLINDCNLLILDEPTTLLTPQETVFLFNFLKKLQEKGKSIIFISHKIKEVMELSDRITILKKGEFVGTLNKNEFNEDTISTLMVGSTIKKRFDKKSHASDDILLELIDIFARNDKGLSDLVNFNLNLRKAEILGIAGISGNGQKALAEVLTGLKDPTSGSIILDKKDVTNGNTRQKYIHGIAHIPEDRKAMGIAPDLSVEENLILKNFKDKKFGRFILNKKNLHQYANNLIEKFNIQYGLKKAPVRLLSGGNIQKVIIARELSCEPTVLVALYPTRGLDVGSQEFIHETIMEHKAKGMSTIYISEDLDELLKISDRIAVIFRGKNMGYVDPENTDKFIIGKLMGGLTESD